MLKRLFAFCFFSLLFHIPQLALPIEAPLKSNTPADSNSSDIQNIEQKTYMPYPVWLVQARRQQDQKPMLSAVFPIFMDRKADGTWKLMGSKEAKQWQKTIQQNPLNNCPIEKNTLDAEVAYKPEAEFFLSRTTLASKASLEIDTGSEKQVGSLVKGCAVFGKEGSPARFASFQKVKEIHIKGLKPSPLSIPLPQDLYPYLLLRYQQGQMLPIPARLDTILFDPIQQRLYLTFRATALISAPLRKIEYRMVGPDTWAKDSDIESREESLERGQAMRNYLDQCPLPQACWAGEVCADPQRPVNMQDLAKALGIKTNSSSTPASRGPDTNSNRFKP